MGHHTAMVAFPPLLSSLLVALAPGWRLFVSASNVPVLQWRAGTTSTTLGDWRLSAAMTRTRARRLHHLVWNPDELTRLAVCSLVDRLAAEAVDGDAEGSATLALVRHQVALEVAQTRAGRFFAFRILLADDGDDASVCLTSGVEDSDVVDAQWREPGR
jgi:hypothetical protein